MEQRRASVLVVEDDPGIRVLLRRALVDDYDVHLAGDGRGGLAANTGPKRGSLIDVIRRAASGEG